jgi:hypothetical protein
MVIFIAFVIDTSGFRLLSNRPLSNDDIEPAAEALIRELGADALSEASRQVSALNSKGFYGLAATWQQIRQKIVERQQRDSQLVTSK